MLRNLFTFLVALCFVCSSVLFGQTLDKSKAVKNFRFDRERVIANQNKLKKQANQNPYYLSSSKILKFDKVAGLIDTFSYRKMLGGDWTNTADGFGHSAQDVCVQWYQAPADLTIKAVGIGTATNDNSQPASIKIIKFINYEASDFLGLILNDPSTLSARLGYYPGEGDGYNNVSPYINDATSGSTGGWVPVDDLPEPFGDDYWSDAGFGVAITPTPQPYDANGYDWVEMSVLGSEPTVLRGEIFGISVSNTGTHPSTEASGNRQAFWAQGVTDNDLNVYPLLKFYEYERTAGTGDFGWWIRPLTLDFVAIVDIFGDEPPQFVEVDALPTTLSTEAREVTASITDRNPGGGAAGVQSATLKYSIDGGTTWSDAAMSNTGGDVWSGSIPGQAPGTVVDYYVEATDVGNNTNQSSTFEYIIFQATPGVNTLLVLNGYSADSGYPQSYYFGIDDFANFETFPFDHDVWAYGPLTAELVNSYTNILEITTSAGGPSEYNDDVIRAWVAASGTHNYMLAGQEWLGARNSYTDLDFAAGTFENDILGVTHSYNDVSYDTVSASGQLIPSKVTPIDGSLLGDSLMGKWNNSTDSLSYDPAYEIGVANWVDGFDVAEGVEVDMTVETRGIGGGPVVENKNCAAHRTLTAGNKIAFLAYDPISIDTKPWDPAGYYWYGFSTVAPQVQILHWFGISTDVKQVNNNIPGQFALKQNYPNPFNPTTSIEYSIPLSGNVTLTIFDILGRKVTDLVNTYQQAGNFSATWDGTNQFGAKVTSGTYFYQLRTDNGFVKTEKMVLLK